MSRQITQVTLGLPLRCHVTQQQKNGDRHVYALRTRFIRREILERFESIQWSTTQSGAEIRPASAPIDIAAQMHTMWE